MGWTESLQSVWTGTGAVFCSVAKIITIYTHHGSTYRYKRFLVRIIQKSVVQECHIIGVLPWQPCAFRSIGLISFQLFIVEHSYFKIVIWCPNG